jgi:AraC family transcriptional regulator
MQNLNLDAQKTVWPKSHYLFIEKIGPFQDTAMACWQELHSILPGVKASLNITTFMSLYKIEPQMIYRAGIVAAEKPATIPAGLKYEMFEGGDYLKYALRGSYSQLPEACGLVFEDVKKKNVKVRDAFYIEHYINDPQTTPEKDLLTEILIPV